MQKAALAAEGVGDSPSIGCVRHIAARAAGHQNFNSRAAILFQQQDAPAALSGSRGGKQSGGAGQFAFS